MQNTSLTRFFLFTFAITWGIAALLLLFPEQMTAWFGPMSSHHPLFFLAVWSPTITAVALTASSEGTAGLLRLLRRLTPWGIGLRWSLVVLLGVPTLGLLAAALGGGIPRFAWEQWYLYIAILGSQFVLDPGPLGEELGWRGYALPRLLARRTPLTASLILGVIWFVWHLPAFFISGTPQNGLALPAFFGSALSLSILATWLFLKTRGSVLPSIFLHLTANFSLNLLGAPLVWFSGLLAILALIVIFLSRGSLRDVPNLAAPISHAEVA